MNASAITTNSTTPPNTIKSKNFELKAEDFIKMMITQLQHQDPMEPAKNEELLAQMSQIGQLQSSTMMQESLKGLVMQSQIGSAGNLIGKTVQGLDDKKRQATGNGPRDDDRAGRRRDGRGVDVFTIDSDREGNRTWHSPARCSPGSRG